MYSQITTCRACQGTTLSKVLSLGEQYLTGVFPRDPTAPLTKGPLDLVWCGTCGLLQLLQSYSLTEMYGETYGYRSGLNRAMVTHLQQKIHGLERLVNLKAGDLVVDIGSNDATSLRAYTGNVRKVGIDPTGPKFRKFYTEDITLIPEFFSESTFRSVFPTERARVVTSIAMFYDLDQPVEFVRQIARILAKDGVWHFEQSYMPSMLRTNAYDTICHEHLEFYSLSVVKQILTRAGLRMVDVQMNAVNGGSFAVTACHQDSQYQANDAVINWMLGQEQAMGLDTLAPYTEFRRRVFEHRASLRDLIHSLVAKGKRIIGYGASTKGNVLLQFCGFGPDQIECIADVNEDKFGAFTPGTRIPIVSEAEAHARKPDYLLVLPWHFKAGIMEREQQFMAMGGKLIFPMPEIEII